MPLKPPYVDGVDVPKPGDLGGQAWRLRDLGSVTIIFGKNGSGKSRLLRAWRDVDHTGTHYVVPERVGELTFEPGYLQSQIGSAGRRDTSQRNYEPNYRQYVITRIQAYFVARGSVRGAISSDGDPTELEGFLRTLLPDFTITLKGAENPPYELVRASNAQKVTDISHLSSGEAQILTLALDILTIGAMWAFQKAPKRLVLIDEPDAHIHPDLLVRFADFLLSVAEHYELQIVVATHSTTLLSALAQFAGPAASLIYLDRIQGEFHARGLTDETKELAACLGGHALMGPLFGVALLLVEGDDDYRLWSQVPRHHKVTFSVIPTNGDEIKQYQKSLERIFSALREPAQGPAGYALLDGDKPLPNPDNPDVPQVHVRFIRMACREAENLYLTDEVLQSLELGWAAAAAKIAEAAGEFGEKAAFLGDAANWDRANVDVKSAISQVTQILDPKNVHWTIRVAKTVGAGRPSGQLYEFLDASVVNAIWGAAAPPADHAN